MTFKREKSLQILKRLILNSIFNQAEIARRAGYSKPNFNMVLSGKRYPKNKDYKAFTKVVLNILINECRKFNKLKEKFL